MFSELFFILKLLMSIAKNKFFIQNFDNFYVCVHFASFTVLPSFHQIHLPLIGDSNLGLQD